jgi:hypothetical protein
MFAIRRRWLVASVLSFSVLAGLSGAAEAQGPAETGDAAVETTVPQSPASAPGAAAVPEASAAREAAAPTPGATRSPAGVPRVRAVHRLLVEHAGVEETAEAAGAVPARPVGLGAVIAVEIAGLEALIAEAGGIGGLVLFLDGIALPGLAPLGVLPERGWLIYRLDRAERADAAWHLLLGNPSSLVRLLSLSVGVDEAHPIPTDVEDFPLAVIHPWELAIFAVLLAAALVAFFAAARRTDLLRDRAANVPPGAVRPYSLARCQMAWWFFLVVVAYVFIWLAIDELDTITPSVLALIGIGAVTALGAGMIDAGKKQNGEEAKAALKVANATVSGVRAAAGAAPGPAVVTPAPAAATAAPAAATAAATAAPEAIVTPEMAQQVLAGQDLAGLVAQQVELSRLQQRASDTEGAVKGASRGFRRDVLWDGEGISLHRFQIVVWTLVLGFIFVASVYAELAMPDFSATLLGLMGISSGTYLGFKLPERQQ